MSGAGGGWSTATLGCVAAIGESAIGLTHAAGISTRGRR
jgi:hypothetical protein